jgi:hypothetical protein
MKKNTQTQLKQSAFNFDFPESSIQPEKVSEADTSSEIVEQIESTDLSNAISIVEEEPIEIDFTPIFEKKKEKVEKKKSLSLIHI